MKKLQPITLKDVVAGQHYIELSVCMDGAMFLTSFVIHGRPFKDRGDLGVNITEIFAKKQSTPRFESAMDMGLAKSPYGDNRHRTFRFNSKNMQILSDLVKRQALSEYLELIGIRRHERTLAEILYIAPICYNQAFV